MTSIAYTSMVSGNQRGKAPDSTHALARVAFGGIAIQAWLHRWSIRLLCVLAILLAVFASWEATKASLGKSLLQVLEPLRAQQSGIATEKFKLEINLDKAPLPVGPSPALSSLAVCDRYLSLAELKTALPGDPDRLASAHTYATPEMRDVCGRDEILSRNLFLAHEALRQFRMFWPDLVGGLYAPSAHLFDPFATWIKRIAPVPVRGLSVQPATDASMKAEVGDDVEFWVAPIVQVVTSFILPFIFGVIGSLLYVILQHYNQLRGNLLLPRDLPLAYLRVILGVVVSVCISLLITGSAGPAAPIQASASGSTAPGSLTGSLSLSASLITFLAGFGAEAVFTLLHKLVQRVFAIPD